MLVVSKPWGSNHLLRIVIEPKYSAFRWCLDTPIIIWEYDWMMPRERYCHCHSTETRQITSDRWGYHGFSWFSARCCHRGVECLEATNQLKIGKLVGSRPLFGRGWFASAMPRISLKKTILSSNNMKILCFKNPGNYFVSVNCNHFFPGQKLHQRACVQVQGTVTSPPQPKPHRRRSIDHVCKFKER